MLNELKNNYILISLENQINDFLNENQNTISILNAIEPQLVKYFSNNRFLLEFCDDLGWTTAEP